jgi:serine protease AprX
MKTHNLHLRWVVPIAVILSVVLALGAPSIHYSIAQFGRQSYIVQGQELDLIADLVAKYNGRITSELPIISGVGAVLPTRAVEQLAAEPGITAITANYSVRMADDDYPSVVDTDYPEVVGADFAWQGNINGQGVTVAVVDTGIGNLQGLLRDPDGLKGRVVGWMDFVEYLPNPIDRNGHGTHISAIIANSLIGLDGGWNGVSPGVNLLPVRVLNIEGWGTYETVIQGIQWVIQNKDVYNVKVMNLSLVSAASSPYWADPLNQAATAAWANGITVVAAAGNGGPGPMSIGVPGNNPYLITVGAFTDNYTPLDWSDDYITPFSAAGPTLDGFVKPDVVAPGAHMVSLMNPGTYIAINNQATRVGSQYFSMAGTSQSAAVVSGISALILQNHPELSPNEVKFRIMVTAFPWIEWDGENFEDAVALYSIWQQGTGRVNAYDAVFEEITGEANYGMDIWADLYGDEPEDHYQGFSYFDDEVGEFKLYDHPDAEDAGYGSWAGGYGSWAGGYGSWAGGYGSWAGGYGSWAGGYGSWAGGYGSWAGGYGSWAGGYGSWAGGYGSWAGGYGSWAGGYGSWAGGYGSWAGGIPWEDTMLADPEFVASFMAGIGPDASSTITSIAPEIEEE